MKRIFAVFTSVFVVGIIAGCAYGWISNHGLEKNNEEKLQEEAVSQESSESQSENSDKESSNSNKEIGTVTNHDKICSTPGCGRAVFVTYKGKELCVKCYGEAKKRDTENN